MALSIDDVLAQMRERGIEPPTKALVPDGKKATWAGDAAKPKKKNAWAVLHEWKSPKTDKVYVVGHYGIRDEHWPVEATQVEWSPAEKTAWLERQKQLEREAARERRELAETAAQKAAKLWSRARVEGGSDYLERKQIGAYGVRFAFGRVLVPLVDTAGTLHGVQWIGPDGAKVFGTGTVKEGHYHLLGDLAQGLPVAFAEGYATAASVYMATGWPVVCCFDSGNLLPVAAAWRKLYPDVEFLFAADDDRHLVRRLCERLEKVGVGAKLGDFARSLGGVRDMRWELPDGRVVELVARWARDGNGVYYIDGSITADGAKPKPLLLVNAGRAKAVAAAKKVGRARVILPHFADRGLGTDWNDLHVSEGQAVVREQLLAPPPEPADDGKRAGRKKAQSPDGGGPSGPSGQGAGADDGGSGVRLRFPFLTDKWEPRGIRENVYFALLEDPALAGLVRYNDFSQQIDRARRAPWTPPEAPDAGLWLPLDDLRLANYVAQAQDLIVASPITVEQAVLMAAQDARYNPVREHLDSIVWDGVERTRHWVADVLGAEESEYTALVGRWFLISMVARVFEPGCQMDYMLVLQGLQGARKSSVLRILAGDYYGGGTFRVGDKDSLQVLQGRILFNLNELDSLNKSELSAIKSFITERSDLFRPPYSKGFTSFPRSCVLTGDTNETDFLRDPTGARRFWVVRCQDINVELMKQWREQLLAEAVFLYKNGERRYPTKEEERIYFEPEQDHWRFIDVWADVLSRYVESNDIIENYDGCLKDGKYPIANRERIFFSTHELFVRALNIDVGKLDNPGNMQRRLANQMKLLGFAAHRWESGRVRPRGWLRAVPVVVAEGGQA